MKTLITSVLVSACVVFAGAVWAAEQNQGDHTAHHPDAAVATGSAPQAVSGNAAKDTMAKMDTHMKAMHEMHEKMMNAKTPEERDALMAEHMKLMKEGMGMMSNMGKMMGGMGMMDGGQGKMQTDMMADMATRHQMMEKRMEMMETMMQMMMDRLPSPPTKSRK